VKPICERCSIVVPGSWNPAILTAQWAKSNLLDGNTPTIEVLATARGLLTQLAYDGVKILIIPDQAQVALATFTDDSINLAEAVITRLLDRLPETPVLGLGVNFGFDDTSESGAINRLLELKDDIAMIGTAVTSKTVARRLEFHDTKRVVNLTIGRSVDGVVHIDFNHHYDVAAAKAASDALKGQAVYARDLSLRIAESVYGLKLNEATE